MVLLAGGFSYARAQVTHQKVIFFEDNKAELTPGTQKTLTAFYEDAEVDAELQVEMIGYIDRSLGIDTYNDILRQRADAVREFFIDAGNGPDRVSVNSIEVNPLMVANNPARDSLANWRVNVLVDKIEKEYVSPRITAIEDAFPKRVQKLKCNPKKRLHVVGKEGTILKAPKHTFVFADGTPAEDEVEIHLREYYKVADMLKADLVTSSHGQMIETGGMMHISAYCKGQEVFIANGKSMSIELPIKGTPKPGMQLFTGQDNGDFVNWQAVGGGSGVIDDAEVDEVITDIVAESEISDVNFRGMRNRGGEDVYADDESFEYSGKAMKRNNILDNYMLETTTLGWINCDRFYEVEQKTNLMVAADTAYQPVVRLVFDEISSIMPGYYNSKDNKFSFNNIPVGYKGTLIAYSIMDDQHYFTSKKVVVTENGLEDLALAKVSEAQMKSSFARLN